MPQTAVRLIVQDGERLRIDLLKAFGRAKEAERGSVLTELLMFYGQAFENVREAVSREVVTQEAGPALVLTKMLHECMWGMAIYRLWLVSGTPLHATVEYDGMDERWEQIKELAGTGEYLD